MGSDRLQPGQAGHSQRAAAAEGEAAVRELAGDRGGRRRARPSLRAYGRLRCSDRAQTSELFGLEQRDVDRRLGVVYVRRAFANGRLKQTKTRLSNRAVPLQAKALNALDQLAPSENPILFPNSRGGRIDFRSFGRRRWKPAQIAAGTEPLRDLYDLRHTYVTFALRAGIPVFAVSRFIGSSIAMVDQHYGHLANDSRQHAVSLLDALALERAVDAAWTSTRAPAISMPKRVSRTRPPRSRRRVDARWTPRVVAVASAEEERSG